MNKEVFLIYLFSSQGESVVEIICLKNNGYYYLKTWISFNLHVCDGKKLKQKTKNKQQKTVLDEPLLSHLQHQPSKEHAYGYMCSHYTW